MQFFILGLLHNNIVAAFHISVNLIKWGVKMCGIKWPLMVLIKIWQEDTPIFSYENGTSLELTAISFYLWAICITIVTSFDSFCQSAQMKHQKVWNENLWTLRSKVGQYDTHLSYYQNAKWLVIFLWAVYMWLFQFTISHSCNIF